MKKRSIAISVSQKKKVQTTRLQFRRIVFSKSQRRMALLYPHMYPARLTFRNKLQSWFVLIEQCTQCLIANSCQRLQVQNVYKCLHYGSTITSTTCTCPICPKYVVGVVLSRVPSSSMFCEKLNQNKFPFISFSIRNFKISSRTAQNLMIEQKNEILVLIIHI